MTDPVYIPAAPPPANRSDPANFVPNANAYHDWTVPATEAMNAQHELNNTLHTEVIEAGDQLLAAVLANAEANALTASVTARQAVQALLLAGITEAMVEAAIAAVPDPVQRGLVSAEWRRSQTFERHRPSLVALATTALGMTTAQLDQLFIVAASLP